MLPIIPIIGWVIGGLVTAATISAACSEDGDDRSCDDGAAEKAAARDLALLKAKRKREDEEEKSRREEEMALKARRERRLEKARAAVVKNQQNVEHLAGIIRDLKRTATPSTSLIQKIHMLGKDFVEDVNSLETFRKYADGHNVIIANAGTTNTGKSTLFNALLGKDGAFRTADIRETTVCRDIDWDEGIVLTDTPGCGSCTVTDDREAARAYSRADLVVFVHNLARGGLKRDEMDVLETVRRTMGDQEFQDRTIIVGTRLDSCPQDSVDTNRRECENQIKSEIGVCPAFVAVSPKRHLRGLALAATGDEEKSRVFLKASGMKDLEKLLKERSLNLGKRGAGRFSSLIDKIQARLLQARNDYRRCVDDLKRLEEQRTDF